MATSNAVFLALVVVVALALSAAFAWTAGTNRKLRRAATPLPQPAPPEVGDHPPTTTTTRRRSALDSSTTQWDRADTRDTPRRERRHDATTDPQE